MKRTLTATALATTLAAVGPTAALADTPYTEPDESWIAMSGTVVDPTASTFRLDYGDGIVLVAMDDFDSYGDAYGLMDGDRVTVYGQVDDDLFERAKIEASSVYVENLNTYFYASAADEEGQAAWSTTVSVPLSQTTVRGTVANVDEPKREFRIDTGASEFTVEIKRMSYNPLDDYGYQQIAQGDVVRVTGQMDEDFLEGRVLDAESVTTLVDQSEATN